MAATYTAIEMIEKLVSFDTVSRNSNLDLIEFVADYLTEHGILSQKVFDETGQKANLYATVGPNVEGGVVLSGHTDVVPVDGQPWDTDPFTIVEKDGKLYLGSLAEDSVGFWSLNTESLVGTVNTTPLMSLMGQTLAWFYVMMRR